LLEEQERRVQAARHRHEDAAGSLDQAAEEVARCRHDHLVPRFQERAEREVERVHGAVRDQDLALGIAGAGSDRAIASRTATRPRLGGVTAYSSSAAATASRT
jgi:hypothetical protein